MTREIPLTRGFLALVDDCDYEMLMAFGNWHAHSCPPKEYAGTRVKDALGIWRTVRMHTVIAPSWPLIDHVNGDGLDNRRENLRPATNAQNMRNRGKQTNNTSGFKGAFYFPRTGRWKSQITVNRRALHLGYYLSAEDAARAYDAAALIHHGEFARLNFPRIDA
jgi:hypothetical protein